MHVLFLYDLQPRVAQTVHDHVAAIRQSSYFGATVYPLPILGDLPESLDLDHFDIILIHYSVGVSANFYLTKRARQILGACSAVKAVFIQDEHRHVDRTVAALRELGCSLIFTCCPEPEKVYGDGFRFVKVLTGYVPRDLLFRSVKPVADRRIDIGYRGRALPAEMGPLSQEKRLIAEAVDPAAREFGLKTDISCREEDRLYGERWIRFIGNCRVMLGTESGADSFDFGDRKERLYMAQISPRCFEAAALRTPMILYEGDYSNVLEPWCHYLPLHKDHSNLGSLLQLVKERSPILQRIADRAFQEVALNERWSYEGHVRLVSCHLYDAAVNLWMKGTQKATGYARMEFMALTSFRFNRRRAFRAVTASPPLYAALRAAHHVLPGTRYRRRLLGWEEKKA